MKNEITFQKLLDGSTVVKQRGGRSTKRHESKVTYNRKNKPNVSL
jgi:hypothetical protein